MPFKEVTVKNEKLFRYKGVDVYHTCKNGNWDEGNRTWWFTLDPYGSDEETEGAFDVRDLPSWSRLCPDDPKTAGLEVDEVRKAWADHDRAQCDAIGAAIKADFGFVLDKYRTDQ